MISIPAGGRIYLACGATDMRRGFDGLAVMVQGRWRRIRIRARCLFSEASAAI